MTGPPILLLLLLLPVIAYLTIRAASFPLFLLSIVALSFPPGDWSLGGIRLGPNDLILLALIFTLFLRPQGGVRFLRVPNLVLWIALGTLTSIAYVVAPLNAANVTDPVRAIYQTLRYCWKPIAMYPLAAMLVAGNPGRRTAVMRTLLITGLIVSVHATIQGYSGMDPSGYFSGGNTLGGALLAPFVMALAGAMWSPERRQKMLHFAATALVVRGIVFANSRGAFVGAAAGASAFLGGMFTRFGSKKLVLRIVLAGFVGITALFVVKPDLLDRPNVKHILTALQGSSDANFQWRTQRRWPYFINVVKKNPWFGIGTNRDTTLSAAANTPHNGYLSMACIFGIPATTIVVLFGAISMWSGWRVFRRERAPDAKLFALVSAASIAGIFVHNIVESTLIEPFVQSFFWVMSAMISVATLRQVAEQPQARATQRRRRPLPQRLPIRSAVARGT